MLVHALPWICGRSPSLDIHPVRYQEIRQINSRSKRERLVVHQCLSLVRSREQDFYVIVCAVYSLLGNVSSPRYDLETIRAHTTTVFQRFDKLHQGFITIQDFMSFCLSVKTTRYFSHAHTHMRVCLCLGSQYTSIDRWSANNRVMTIVLPLCSFRHRCVCASLVAVAGQRSLVVFVVVSLRCCACTSEQDCKLMTNLATLMSHSNGVTVPYRCGYVYLFSLCVFFTIGGNGRQFVLLVAKKKKAA